MHWRTLQWKARNFKQTPFKDFLNDWIKTRERKREKSRQTDRQRNIDYCVEKNQGVTVD